MEHFFVQNRWVDPSQNFLGWSPMPLILARQLLFASNVRPRELHSLLSGQLSRLLEVGKETLTMFSSCWRVVLPLHRCELNFCRWLLSVPLRGRPYQPTGHFSHKPPLEPVGGSAPKFPALTLPPSMAEALPFSLSCPAQGAPVPTHRPVTTHSFLEPVGGSSPKFSALSSSSTLTMPSFRPFSLSCPAQGSPVPAYRPV